MGMVLVEVWPGDKALYFVTCPHCGQGFGKGAAPELAFESPDQQTALHQACVNALAGMQEPAQRVERREALLRELVAGARALSGIESVG